VFTSSAAFIDTILHPHGTVNTGVADESLLSLRNDERESEESFVQQEAAEKPSPYAFRFDGVSWHLRFPGDYGDKECPFNDMKGLRFYAKILANKGKPVTADDLYGHDRKRLGGNLPPDKAISKAGLDAAFRAFDLVAEQVRVAKEKEDQDETKLLLERLNALQDAIEKDFDPITGKIRVIQDKRTGNPPRAAERVMRDALLAINKKMPKLMIYLQRNCKKITQNTWQYESVDKIEWEF
jgi:predicted transposase YbfD/YdcC